MTWLERRVGWTVVRDRLWAWSGLKVMASHYLHAWLGIGCRFDPDEEAHPGSPLAVVIIGGLIAVGLLAQSPRVRWGALAVLACAAWWRAWRPSHDRVIEWRGYSALAGVALIAADLLPLSVSAVLVALGVGVSARRAWACRSELAFRAAAARESPHKVRTQGQWANALRVAGAVGPATRVYQWILGVGTPEEQAVAEHNLKLVWLPDPFSTDPFTFVPRPDPRQEEGQ